MKGDGGYMNEKERYIKERCEAEGIILSPEHCGKLYIYFEKVIETNKVMNLTAITDFEEFVTKHFVDSLMISKAYDMKNVTTLLDVGTGAGFPGIPIKILYPDIEILLLDSLNKRLNFLNEVITSLELKNISTIHARAEELQSKGDYRDHFDLVVSRAVAALPTLSEYCLPYVKKGGAFISYKSRGAEEEISESKKAISVLGGKLISTKNFTLAGTDYERTLIVVEKTKETPKKYPRSGGKPSKQPII